MLLKRKASKGSRFEALVRAFTPELYRYAFWLCGRQATAEDLVQETFARAWRSFDDLRDEQATKAWLLTILRREHARLFERQRPEARDMDFDRFPATVSGEDVSAQALALRKAVARLPAGYAEPLLLQVLGGCSAEEIARIMNLSPSAVMTRLHRARRKLRAEPGDGEEPQGRAGRGFSHRRGMGNAVGH
ncbi:MAG: sigma-70 family RNA polymerase sigma factor [Gammaproteobacteria bacterium]|nr:sigma-70 family RNA polymerase sigma factor [Gammaproteobacteria bacterium]NIR84137.1 sigma-70 family RNA polymerase sigma factor [Gammaproteobacteria bacterium]NIR89449.1 sigma-70 family RNA polymerase sigma factor [Gammaproteobacteria bacterium]NIU05292.1 sigma-70 family RNA polymerase sigma factor [Gammaproteobacteria bacterium]NIV52232.1 sigma-70 family RNA polymerase sigma factor [Gammaproteobacteria bacterium]